MSVRSITYDLKSYLEENFSRTRIEFPNVEDREAGPLSKPYVMYEEVRLPPLDNTLDQSSKSPRGLLILTVVDKVGDGTTVSDEISDELEALFLSASRIETNTCAVVVQSHPHVEEGRRDGSDWKTRVLISYTTERLTA